MATGALLCLQLLLVVLFTFQENHFEPHSPNVAVADFAPDTVDTIELSGDDGSSVTLQKKDESWVLAGDEQVPADSKQVSDFLEKFAGFKRGLAVATTKEAAERFKVGDKDYSSRVVLKRGGDVLADIYFGTSAGFKQLHARSAGSSEVITVSLGSHEVSPQTGAWVEKDLLNLEQEKVAGLLYKDKSIEKDDEGRWAVTDAAGEPKEAEEITALIEKICGLAIVDVGKDFDDSVAGEEGSVAFSLVLDDGSRFAYQAVKRDETTYGLKRSDFDYPLSVSSWKITEITELMDTIDSLFVEAEAESAAEEK